MDSGCIAGTAGNVSENGPWTRLGYFGHDVNGLRESRGWHAITDCADAHILECADSCALCRLKASAKRTREGISMLVEAVLPYRYEVICGCAMIPPPTAVCRDAAQQGSRSPLPMLLSEGLPGIYGNTLLLFPTIP